MASPELTVETLPEDVRAYYRTKRELVDFCRARGLPTSGGKQLLEARIEASLRRQPLPTAARTARSPEARAFEALRTEQLTSLTAVPAGARCTQAARRWLETNVSPQFRFTVTLQRHVAAHPGITLAEVGAAWEAERAARKEGALVPPIEPQFELNRFTRDYFADPANAGRSPSDCRAAWLETRARRGPRTYVPKK